MWQTVEMVDSFHIPQLTARYDWVTPNLQYILHAVIAKDGVHRVVGSRDPDNVIYLLHPLRSTIFTCFVTIVKHRSLWWSTSHGVTTSITTKQWMQCFCGITAHRNAWYSMDIQNDWKECWNITFLCSMVVEATITWMNSWNSCITWNMTSRWSVPTSHSMEC